MVKTVFDLLSEIYNGNFDKLPKKIKVYRVDKNDCTLDEIIFEKDGHNYFSVNSGYKLLKYFQDKYSPEEILHLLVKEVKENKRWKPKYNEDYYFVNSFGEIDCAFWSNEDEDNYRYLTRNCYKTVEEAQRHLDNIKTYYELKDLADELNNGEEIDWKDNDQNKYFIYYDTHYEKIKQDAIWTDKQIGQIYCLDVDFDKKAIKRIGENRLIKLLKEE